MPFFDLALYAPGDNLSPHITAREVACECAECFRKHEQRLVRGKINTDLILAAEDLRGAWNLRWPDNEQRIVITSGFRCEEQNQAIGGARNSSHTTGQALDVRCGSPERLWSALDVLFRKWRGAITRIEIGYVVVGGKPQPRHLHLDAHREKKQQIVWLGMSQ